MNSAKPIGIFDSGVGGTSIWKEIHEHLPNEHTIYLADSKYAPYGDKSKAEILRLSIKNTEKLIALGCKLIVVACNTATTNAIDYLRGTYNIPFVAIEPAIKPAALSTKTKAVGILATKGTLNSTLFTKTSDLYARDIELIEVIGKGLVQEIEAGRHQGAEVRRLLDLYLKPMLDKNIDYLVLGCSHYPYLLPILEELLPTSVSIIDSGRAVARQTETLLAQLQLLNTSQNQITPEFYSNTTDLRPLKTLTNAETSGYVVKRLDF